MCPEKERKLLTLKSSLEYSKIVLRILNDFIILRDDFRIIILILANSKDDFIVRDLKTLVPC